MESHLLQMRGLKHTKDADNRIQYQSHLLQMRGLKPNRNRRKKSWKVASFTDAWIETSTIAVLTVVTSSHLLQMRGLKLHENHRYKKD